MTEAVIANLLNLTLRLCKVSEDIAAGNPLEAAMHCARQGYKELALLLLHIPLTHNLMTSAGLVLVNPWEDVLDVCVVSKKELESTDMGIRELKSFTLEVSTGKEEEEERGRSRWRIRSESYYVAVLDVLDLRTNTRYHKAFVYYLAPLGGPFLQFNVFIIFDTDWIKNVVETVCRS
jgi:hypothetical protein